MAKQRAKIQFVVELNPIEIEVPSQEAGQALVKKLNTGLRAAIRKATNLPKEAKLTDQFNGVLSGRLEGQEGGGFVFKEFGSGASDDSDASEDAEEDNDESSTENVQGNSEDNGVSASEPADSGVEETSPEASSEGSEEPQTSSSPARRFKKPDKR